MLKIGAYSFEAIKNWDLSQETLPGELKEYLANAIHDFKLNISSFKDEFNAIYEEYSGDSEEFWKAVIKSRSTDLKVWAVLSDLSYYFGNEGYVDGGPVEACDYGSPSNDKANLSGNMKIRFLDKDKEGLCSAVHASGEDTNIRYSLYNMLWDEEYSLISKSGYTNDSDLKSKLNKARLYKELAFFFEPHPTYIGNIYGFDGQGFGIALLNCIHDSIKSGDWLLVLAAMKTSLNYGYFNCPEVIDLLSGYTKTPQVKDFLLKHCGYNILGAFHPSELVNLSDKELANLLPTILSYAPYAPFRCDTKFTKMEKGGRSNIVVPRYSVSGYFTSENERRVLDYAIHGVPQELGISSIRSIPSNKLGAANKALSSIRKVLTTDSAFANKAGNGISCSDWTYAELHNTKICDDAYDVLDITYLYLYKKDGTYSTLSMLNMGTNNPEYDKHLWGPIENQVADLIGGISSLFGSVQSIIFPVNGNITCGTITKSVQEKGTVHVLLGN